MEIPAHGFEEDKRNSLTCSVCLDIFRCPKFLPCHHCFCLHCIEGLVENADDRSSFRCPKCREKVEVPPGGVVEFKNNFYIMEEELQRARDGLQCLTHSPQKLDAYCLDCQQPACYQCVTIEHKDHQITDLHKAAGQACKQLKGAEGRLQKAVSHMTDYVAAEKEEQQSRRDKKAAVVKVIKRKQAWLKSLVDKHCEDTLASLDLISEDVDSCLAEDLDHKQNDLDQLNQLLQRSQQAVSSGTSTQLVLVAKEVMDGRGSLHTVDQLMSAKRSSIQRPVLSSKVAEDTIMPLVRDFIGVVEEVKMEVTAPEVQVRKQFCCGEEEEDIEVFSLCPVGDGSTVVVSFSQRGLRDDAPSEMFYENGKHIKTEVQDTGKRTWKSRGNKNAMSMASVAEGFDIVYDKSQKNEIFLLENHASKGEAVIFTLTVISEEPFDTKDTILFTIKVAAHRAFAVDSSGQLFVVLEEVDCTHGVLRKVCLYHRGQRDAVATYQPPSASCWLSDVCFWQKPGGREILVVADEGMDSLHMVDVRNRELRFEGYLAPGHPLITQPTSLNTDTQGRLWVALRGGQILTLCAIA